MEKKIYPLKDILETIFSYKNNKVKKRLIYDKTSIGGFNSKWLKILLILMPFVMYGAIFNPSSFEYLGIAQAIVFYIILLVFAMQIVMLAVFFNNRTNVKNILPSWEHYFPNIDLKMVLSSGVTPYVDFIKYYESGLNENLNSEALHKQLQTAFIKMEDENRDLVLSIQRDKEKQAKNK